jgi:hypothetical protein
MILRVVRTEEGSTSTSTALPTPIPSPSTPVPSLKDIAYLQNTGQQSLLANILASTSSSSPSPSPTPTPAPAPASTYRCYDGPLAVPEIYAEQMRNGSFTGFELYLASMNTPTCGWSNRVIPALTALVNSPVPVLRMDCVAWENIPAIGPEWFIPVTYSGTQNPTTSIPGTTITNTTPAIPAPVMPAEVTPLINSITSAVTQQISSPILESSADLATISNAIEAPYIADLEDISTTTTNLTGDIIKPQVTAINQLYDDTYPVGISPPTVDQIISGEIPYNPNLPPGASTCPAPILSLIHI